MLKTQRLRLENLKRLEVRLEVIFLVELRRGWPQEGIMRVGQPRQK